MQSSKIHSAGINKYTSMSTNTELIINSTSNSQKSSYIIHTFFSPVILPVPLSYSRTVKSGYVFLYEAVSVSVSQRSVL